MSFVQIKQIQKGASDSLTEVHVNPNHVVAIYDKLGNQFVNIWMTSYTDTKDGEWYSDLTALGQVSEIAQDFMNISPAFLTLTSHDAETGNDYTIYINAKYIMNIRSADEGTYIYLRNAYQKDQILLKVSQELEEVKTMISNIEIALV